MQHPSKFKVYLKCGWVLPNYTPKNALPVWPLQSYPNHTWFILLIHLCEGLESCACSYTLSFVFLKTWLKWSPLRGTLPELSTWNNFLPDWGSLGVFFIKIFTLCNYLVYSLVCIYFPQENLHSQRANTFSFSLIDPISLWALSCFLAPQKSWLGCIFLATSFNQPFVLGDLAPFRSQWYSESKIWPLGVG